MLFITMYGYSIKSKNMFESPIWGGYDIELMHRLIFFALIVYGRISFKGEKLHFFIMLMVSLLLPILFTGGYGSLWCAFANITAFYYLYNY